MKKITPEITLMIFDLRKAGWNYKEISIYINEQYNVYLSPKRVSKIISEIIHKESYPDEKEIEAELRHVA